MFVFLLLRNVPFVCLFINIYRSRFFKVAHVPSPLRYKPKDSANVIGLDVEAYLASVENLLDLISGISPT